ncbi:hypothetical protein [Streptomyces decoyicus]|uniref:hypothetical protein n=1 Tax=Streptomyces decoyicus TaxID=249567 RepID=UPI00386FE55B|nr:hypothetical protein OG532_00995 [Streptomyces decoyicus]
MSSGAARGKSVDPHEANTSGTIRTRTTSAVLPAQGGEDERLEVQSDGCRVNLALDGLDAATMHRGGVLVLCDGRLHAAADHTPVAAESLRVPYPRAWPAAELR